MFKFVIIVYLFKNEINYIMKQIIVILSIIFWTAALHTQWISTNSGSGNIDLNIENARGTAITSDIYENCYVTGYCYDSNTGTDIITIMYDQNGDTVWVRRFNGTANMNDEGSAISLDKSGNICVAGTSANLNTSYDFTVLKYNQAGVLLWANTFSLQNNFADDKGADITVDSNNDLIITGFGTTGAGNTVLVTRKISEYGTELWTNTETSFTGNSQAVKLAVNVNNDVFITGFVSNGYSSDMVVIKYDISGNKVFQRVIGGEGEDKAWGIAVDDDNVIITGTITNSAGNTDCYTAKFDSAGNSIWGNTFNGTGNGEDKAWGIAVDDDAAVYITGSTTDLYGNVNYITVKYDGSGTQLWASEYNGSGNGRDVANAIGLIYRNGTVAEVVSAGESTGSENNLDYATVRYDTETGNEISISRYSLSSTTDDRPLDIAVSVANGRVYLTGYSQFIAEDRLNSSSSGITSLMYIFNSSTLKHPVSLIPSGYMLRQNFPNPFNPSTTIRFSIPQNNHVRLVVFDINGKEIDIPLDAPM